MRIVGIRRGAEFSPNMADADTAIFEAVAGRLEARGHEVLRTDDTHAIDLLLRETEAGSGGARMAFSMSRNAELLAFLQADRSWARRTCINSALGISLCSERRMVNSGLEHCGIPLPATRVTATAVPSGLTPVVSALQYPFWMKRNKGYSQVKEDVVLVHNDDEAMDALRQFGSRGEDEVLCCQHVEGDLVKFYGVEGTGFFDWDYADPAHSKFGLEAANGLPHHYAFDGASLHTQCDAMAAFMRVPVYGGDAIVRPDGTYVVIDFNDWPSFSRCREQAAEAIANRILRPTSP